MIKLIISVLFGTLIICIACTKQEKANVNDEQLRNMRNTAMDFMKELKGILVKEIQRGGVKNAVAVCSDTAQMLTNNFGMEKGVYIRRVSFKNRNKNNYPDQFEGKILNKFQLMHQNNELDETSESIEISEEGEFVYIRYMKPILVQAECLNCHGNETDIQGETGELIAKRYPEDKAVEYKLGDLRGAVSLKKVIE